ncbi:MAG: HAD family hydrolase [Clostridia bacterium]
MNSRLSKGVIFDMDNTLLKSRINFAEMKRAIFQLLVEKQMCEPTLDWEHHTASQLIEIGRQSERNSKAIESQMWEAVTFYEKEGMHGAVLEDHAVEVLEELHQRYHLFILTNNASAAAREALAETGITHFFEEIVAREQMSALKPSPSGIHYILNQYPQWSVANWTMVGDSWIDGKAAQDGGVRFVAYRGKRLEMERNQVAPIAYVDHLHELLSIDFEC